MACCAATARAVSLTDFAEQPQTAGSGPGTVALGDFDHDGHLDIAKTDSIVRYAGNGTFSSEPYVPAPGPSATAVAAGDFNGDGWLDVATANSTGNTVSVLLNDRTWGVTPPTISISDAPMITEGNTGTVNATFTVTLSKPSTAAVTVSYATEDIFATAGSDYVAKTGTLTIPAGQTSGTITVAVIGDRIVESTTEEFAVQLTSATNATIANARGTGRILDDEPRINIGNVSKSEGTGNGKNNTTTTFTFTVSLSNAYDQAVTVNYATANGTATAGSDYQCQVRQRDLRARRDGQDDHDRRQRRQDQGVERNLLRGPLRPEQQRVHQHVARDGHDPQRRQAPKARGRTRDERRATGSDAAAGPGGSSGTARRTAYRRCSGNWAQRW